MAVLARSPPDRVDIFLKTSSPLKRKAARAFLTVVWERAGTLFHTSSRTVFVVKAFLGLVVICGFYPYAEGYVALSDILPGYLL